MNVVDWLATPLGIEFTHAAILLITALASYLGYLAHRTGKRNQQLLDGHLRDHTLRSQSPAPPPLSDLPPEA